MEESNRKVSESQRAAQRKYDKKTKMVSVKYTPSDMEDYERLKNYLTKTGQHTNKFIKSLINDFFDSGKGEIYENYLDKRLHDRQEYWVFKGVEKDKVQFIMDNVGTMPTRRILTKYTENLRHTVVEQRDEMALKFSEWIEEVIKQIEMGEYKNLDGIQKMHKLRDSINEYFETM